MKKIPLTQGKFAIVDDEDFAYLSRFNWYVMDRQGFLYAERRIEVDTKRGHDVNMKHFIIDGKGGYSIAFKSKDTLDLRKENLIFVTTKTRANRATKATGKSSDYKGVWFNKTCPNKPWCANIEQTLSNGKIKRFRKQFATENEAGRQYNKIALEWFGDYAYQNKIV